MSSLPLAQSADKQVLFARLGLNEQVHKMLLVCVSFGDKGTANTSDVCRMMPRVQETPSVEILSI
jgi:hypothetical protein